MDEPKVDVTNVCYEALLDLKCTFPAWSEVQGNFFYHWRRILDSIIKCAQSENKVLEFYSDALQPLVAANGNGIESSDALAIVQQLDAYRSSNDETFTKYDVELVLNRDTSSIKPKPKEAKKAPPKPKPAAPAVVPSPSNSSHVYGTRNRSRQSGQGSDAGGLDYNSATMGTHLKRGFSSNFVWDFMLPSDEDDNNNNNNNNSSNSNSNRGSKHSSTKSRRASRG